MRGAPQSGLAMLICRIRSRSLPSSCWRRTRLSASSLARDLKSERSAYASSFSHSAMQRQRTRFHATCHTDRIFGNDTGPNSFANLDGLAWPEGAWGTGSDRGLRGEYQVLRSDSQSDASLRGEPAPEAVTYPARGLAAVIAPESSYAVQIHLQS